MFVVLQWNESRPSRVQIPGQGEMAGYVWSRSSFCAGVYEKQSYLRLAQT